MSAREEDVTVTVGALIKGYTDALAAERALSDRLAEALVAIIGVADLDAALEDVNESDNDAEAKGLKVLAAHAERRKV